MAGLLDSYTKNKSAEDKKEIERRVKEIGADMSLQSAILYVLAEMREEAKKNGGMIDKPLGSGGVKSGPPPKSGPTPQGLKVPLKQVKQ